MENKEIVAHFIYDYDIEKDWKAIQKWRQLPAGTNAGNQIVDYYTLYERLNTRRKSKPSFYEFVACYDEYSNKNVVHTLIEYCDNHNRYSDNHIKRCKYMYNCIMGSINIFKPIRMIEILMRYPPKIAVLDPTMGWGGRLVGSCILNIPRYIGIDNNVRLKEGYLGLTNFLKEKSDTKISIHFEDATTYDYKKHRYDVVITSPPYYDVEIYGDKDIKMCRNEWNQTFYRPMIMGIWEGLEEGGYIILNINQSVYEYILSLLGEPVDVFAFKKYNRSSAYTKEDNKYREMVYVWKKEGASPPGAVGPHTP